MKPLPCLAGVALTLGARPAQSLAQDLPALQTHSWLLDQDTHRPQEGTEQPEDLP